MRNSKSIWKRLALLALGTAVGLAIAECTLRLAAVSFPLPYAPDSICGTRHLAGFRGWWTAEGRAYIRINQYGFRHGDRGLAKPADTARIAVLGDSFIEAFQVDRRETVSARLEAALNDRRSAAGAGVQVLPFGVSGYGTAQELLMLRHYAWAYQPDTVVLAVFPGNDVRNNSVELEPEKARPFFHIRDERLVPDDSFRQHPTYRKACSPSVRAKVALINRCRLLQLLNRWRQRASERAVEAPGGEFSGIDLDTLVPPGKDAWRRAWQLTERLILEVRAEATKHSAKFLLVVIGTDVQVHPDPQVRAALARRLGVADLDYAERRLEELGNEHGFRVLALAGPMREYAERNHVFLHGFPGGRPGYGHWNREGHRLAAELIAGALTRDAAEP